jgi:hypothetical protein
MLLLQHLHLPLQGLKKTPRHTGWGPGSNAHWQAQRSLLLLLLLQQQLRQRLS